MFGTNIHCCRKRLIVVFHTATGLKRAGETTVKRRNQCAAKLANVLYGPPDKTSNFGTSDKKRSQSANSNAHAFESDDD